MRKYSQRARLDFSLPTSCMDMTSLIALCLLLGFQSAAEVTLPRLETPDTAAAAATAVQPLQVVIRSSGELLWKDQSLELTELPAHLQTAGGEAKLQLLLEVDAAGLGNTQRLVQVVDSLQKAKIPNPLSVRVAPSSAAAVPEVQP
jgi:biopolymer transport protein ExbD